jgi:predicted metal-dependent hydrolase
MHNKEIDYFVQEQELFLGERKILLSIRTEKRRSSRVSFTKTGLAIVLSHYLKNDAKVEQIKAFVEWARKKIIKHPELIDQYLFQRIYKQGDILELYDEKFLIKCISNPTKEATIKIRTGELVLSFPENAKEDRKNKLASKMVARIMALYFKDKITKRVLELNEQFFKKNIKSVVLKNNVSNWGSCSIRNNINLSVRLLFAPKFVSDYVIIHELTHLIHMNHSDVYWAHVASVMPDYMLAENWLKKHGNECVF